MRSRAFTLIELLVVVSVIAVLVGILIPALTESRSKARSTRCLVNLRSLETAHWNYMTDQQGWLIPSTHSSKSWIDILRDSYDPALLLRSPQDTSPYFSDGGTPEPNSGLYRYTSYGINLYLSPDGTSHGLPKAYGKLDQVKQPSHWVHFVITAFLGDGAVRDHVHPNLWWHPNPSVIPSRAKNEVQINAYGGPTANGQSKAGYGFLDGHAENRAFSGVYDSGTQNSFDPSTGQ
ncbi:MAG: prepilin-type N-terminal cleavage/methylation domain-containing protein [Phycisphaera sp.]|nr:prepilin-type N-terminal cleavage/methylation domain-containing protein [Phycisphaera sp.]